MYLVDLMTNNPVIACILFAIIFLIIFFTALARIGIDVEAGHRDIEKGMLIKPHRHRCLSSQSSHLVATRHDW